MEPINFIERAKEAASEAFSQQHPAEPMLYPEECYIVWFSKTLQNWKALVSTDSRDGVYIEVTHNGNKDETYIDIYAKVSNTCLQSGDY